MVADTGAQAFQRQPGVLVRLAVDDTLHQTDDRAGDRVLVAHRRLTVTFGSLARLVTSGSAGSAVVQESLVGVVHVDRHVFVVEREVADDLRRALLDGVHRDDVGQQSRGALGQNGADDLDQARLVDEGLS